jgi:DNA-binding LytR/AlgR family response regulator
MPVSVCCRPRWSRISCATPEVFWQIHRSAIVRAAAIDRVRRDELGKHWLTLKGRDEVFPVSSACQGRFRGM